MLRSDTDERQTQAPWATDSGTGLWVVCLCAEWCGVCRDWRGEMAAVAAAHPGVQLRWLDIEEEADLLDRLDIEIETLPTLLLFRAGQTLFFGPIPPRADALSRLIRNALSDGVKPQAVEAPVAALQACLGREPARLRAV
ncbi:thioredoxin family protein [Hydrogenophaga sp. OTU3427]|uniref:thioredoxin family protein n=1 Tax=Hydrogenophaga sp. OTU3427 TaxID=3043856 RepID=UPI00313D3530